MDVIVGKALPFRRFVRAGGNPRRALVAIEHGGRGQSVALYRLAFTNEKWNVGLEGFTFTRTVSPTDSANAVVTHFDRTFVNPTAQRTALLPLN